MNDRRSVPVRWTELYWGRLERTASRRRPSVTVVEMAVAAELKQPNHRTPVPSLHLPADDPRPQRPAVHLARPVVDPERPRVAEDALDHRVAGDAQAAQDLQRAVGGGGERRGADDLAHR